MNKVKLKGNENKLVVITPPPIKVTGIRFPEWAATWKIEKVNSKKNFIEIKNLYYDYSITLPLDIVHNFDEDFRIYRNPFSIIGILKLKAQLRLAGNRVIVEKNVAWWKKWHHRNYLEGKKGVPFFYPHRLMRNALRKILNCHPFSVTYAL